MPDFQLTKGFLFSSLAHSFLIAAVLANLNDNTGSKKYYTIDLAINAAPRESGATAKGPAVVVPKESKDFLETTPIKPLKTAQKKPITIAPEPLPNVPKALAGPSQATVGIGEGQTNFPFPFYLQGLRGKIASNWDVGFWRDGRLSRKAQVAFTVRRSGEIGKPELTEKSGDLHYDLTCLRSISLSAPFPPLPQGLDQDTLRIVFDFEIAP